MNLLDKASIILTPSAYNNGEALCVKPSDGSGDFDFSRNSAATRVNAQGLVEDVQILSSNLVQNGDFSEQGVEEVSNGSFSQQGSQLVTNGDFSDGTNGWINGNSNLSVVDGKLKILATAPFSYARQNIAVVSGKTYKITANFFYNSLVGNIEVYDGTTNTLSEQLSEDGLITLYVTSSSTNLRLTLLNRNGVSGDFNYWDNVSCVEVGQDWTFGTGWSVGEDKAVKNSGNSAFLSQTAGLGNNTYKITFTISDVTNGTLSLMADFSTTIQSFTSNGDYTVYYQPNDQYIVFLSNSTFNGSITNISVKEVGQNWTLGSGWSIGDDKAKHIGGQSDIFQSFGTGYFNGKTISVTYTISDYVSGQVNFAVFNPASINGISRSTNGTFTEFISINTDGGQFGFRTSSSVDFIGSITNISVLEITDDTNLPRINYEGFSYQDALGSEEIVNGDFSDGSAWTKVNATISGGLGNLDATGGTSLLFQSILTDTKTYTATFTVSNYNGLGEARVIDASGAALYTITNNGTFTFTFTHSNASGQFLFRARTNAIFSIDNVSVKEYLGQEVVPDSGCGSWLWEPQSTNLVTYSEDFSDSSWLKFNTTVTSGFSSPDGALNAYKLTEDTSSAKHQILTNISSYTELTISFFAKKAERSFISVEKSSWGSTIFNLNNGSVVSGTGNVVDFGNGWYRCSATYTASPAQSQLWILLMENQSTVNYQGDGTSGVYIWGAQAEQQSYATSYIPTDGTSVTRNQDVCTNGGSVSTINSTEGVLYAEIAALADDLTYRIFSINDGSRNNRVYLQYTNASNTLAAVVKSSNNTQANMALVLSDETNFIKVGFKYKANDFALWVNGVEVDTDTSGLSPIGLNNLAFNDGTSNNFFGKTKALAVFPFLTDTELAELTTI